MPRGVPKAGKRNVKPHAGHFKSGDPRSNKAGQRSAVVVAFSRQIREIIVTVGEETAEGTERTRIEDAVRGLYKQASEGNVPAFNALIERVEGKVAQKIDVRELTNEQLLAALAAADSGQIEG